MDGYSSDFRETKVVISSACESDWGGFQHQGKIFMISEFEQSVETD